MKIQKHWAESADQGESGELPGAQAPLSIFIPEIYVALSKTPALPS